MSGSTPLRPARARMFSRERWQALAQEQQRLVGQARLQRVELAGIHAQLQASSLWLDTGLSFVRSIRAHPQVVLLSLLAVSMSFGRQMSQARSWTVRGLALHQLYKVMGSGLMQALRRRPAETPASTP